MGSDRTELAWAIFGADPTDAGTVTVAGHTLSGHSPAESIAAGLGFLTEDRKQQGLVLQGILPRAEVTQERIMELALQYTS